MFVIIRQLQSKFKKSCIKNSRCISPEKKILVQTNLFSKIFCKSIIGQCPFIGISDAKWQECYHLIQHWFFSTYVFNRVSAILAEPYLFFVYYLNTKYVVNSKKFTFIFHLSFVQMFSLFSLFLKFSDKRFIWCFYFLPLFAFRYTGLACRGFDLKIW